MANRIAIFECPMCPMLTERSRWSLAKPGIVDPVPLRSQGKDTVLMHAAAISRVTFGAAFLVAWGSQKSSELRGINLDLMRRYKMGTFGNDQHGSCPMFSFGQCDQVELSMNASECTAIAVPILICLLSINPQPPRWWAWDVGVAMGCHASNVPT